MISIILCAVGTVWVIGWYILYFQNRKRFQTEIGEVDGSEYFFKDLFFLGYGLTELLKIDFSAPYFQKKLYSLSEMFEPRMAKKIMATDLAAQLTYAVSFLPIGIFIAAIAGDPLLLGIAALLVAFLIVYVEYDKKSKLAKRHEVILHEFPHVLSQLALLMNAGMPLREALNLASRNGEGTLYQEISVLNDDIRNGMPEYEALGKFADRCGVDSVRKFANLIVQNVRKGSAELAGALMDLSAEVWRTRVSSVREEGEKAEAKLMLPILIIFGGIILMVVVPIFKNMSL